MSGDDETSEEFGTVADWTAQAARELGPDHLVPGTCRGSGGPGAMRWLLERLPHRPGTRLLDVGAGIGGPARFAAEQHGIRPVLVEPEMTACRAARGLFGFDTLCAGAAALPVRTGSFDAAWSLGVLCTTADHLAVLRELRRVLRPGGVLGMVVYGVDRELEHPPAGNNFPLRAGLGDLLAAAGLELLERICLDDLPDAPDGWDAREQAVRARVEDEHGTESGWQVAADEEAELGELLSSGRVVGDVLLAVSDPAGTGT